MVVKPLATEARVYFTPIDLSNQVYCYIEVGIHQEATGLESALCTWGKLSESLSDVFIICYRFSIWTVRQVSMRTPQLFEKLQTV